MKAWIAMSMVFLFACVWTLPASAESPCERRPRPVCKVKKPCLAAIEDCLAYALDIPLAMLSPITCPIVSSIRDALDPVEDGNPGRARRNR
ncbi:MAG: hypothetical protein AB1646_13325 [Thermodesulfobacteriota bacterium]